MIHRGVLAHWLVLLCLACSFSAAAQTPPSARDVATYPPLFLAVVNADETMLQRADQRLYLAKSAGRNRAIVADPLALAQE